MAYSLVDILSVRAGQTPDWIALQAEDGEITYASWQRRSISTARRLSALGITHEEIVALEGDSMTFVESAVVYMALEMLGAIVLVIPQGISDHDKEVAFNSCSVRHVVISSTNNRYGIVTRDVSANLSMPNHSSRWSEVLFSSGTTGEPKLIGCPMDEICYLWNPEQQQITERNVEVHGASWGTNFSQEIMRSSLLWGSQIITPKRITGKDIISAVKFFGANTLRLSPPLARSVARLSMEKDIRMQVKDISISSAASTPELLDSLASSFPNATIINQFSATESGRARLELVWNSDPRDVLGRPVDGTEVRIDYSKRSFTCESGNIAGVIQLRHKEAEPRVIIGGKGETIEDGWIDTGDLGYIRADGFVVLIDRSSDVINCGGRMISPLSVEQELRLFSCVRDVIVVGIPHPTLGQIIGALIVPGIDNMSLSDVPLGQMDPLLRPEIIRFVDSVPLTRAGKPDRKEALRLLQDMDGQSSRTVKKAMVSHDKAMVSHDKALSIVSSLLPVSNTELTKSWVAGGGDSLMAVELMDVLLEDFDIAVDAELFDASHTIGDLIDFIARKLNKKGL